MYQYYLGFDFLTIMFSGSLEKRLPENVWTAYAWILLKYCADTVRFRCHTIYFIHLRCLDTNMSFNFFLPNSPVTNSQTNY